MTTPRTRFAPSPTGELHLGHAFAAKVAHDLARGNGGAFLLRYEDIDQTRVRAPYYEQIEVDLRWLELHWDGPTLRQTERLPAYERALRRLQELNVIYPCFCTRREIQAEASRMLSAPHGTDGPPYPGTCRNLPLHAREEKLEAGLPHAWRLDHRTAAQLTGPLDFTDLRFGKIHVLPHLPGDVVLARKDIGTAYHLAVVVDDAFQEITHVTRGEDLLESTHVHRQLQALLGLPEPLYLHHPLIPDANGKRLAKRDGSLAISTLRESGRSPEEIFSDFPPPTGR